MKALSRHLELLLGKNLMDPEMVLGSFPTPRRCGIGAFPGVVRWGSDLPLSSKFSCTRVLGMVLSGSGHQDVVGVGEVRGPWIFGRLHVRDASASGQCPSSMRLFSVAIAEHENYIPSPMKSEGCSTLHQEAPSDDRSHSKGDCKGVQQVFFVVPLVPSLDPVCRSRPGLSI